MKTKITEHDHGFIATRPGTPTIVVFALTPQQARARAARQLRSWRRYQRDKREASRAH